MSTPVEASTTSADRRRAQSRRPITPEEVEPLERLGEEVRSLRLEAGLTREAAAFASEMSTASLWHIENGLRRTRRSTLERVAQVIVDNHPTYAGSVQDLTEFFCSVAGIALAPESQFPERVARRRRRRMRKAERAVTQDDIRVFKLARQMFDQWVAEERWRRTYPWVKPG